MITLQIATDQIAIFKARGHEHPTLTVHLEDDKTSGFAIGRFYVLEHDRLTLTSVRFYSVRGNLQEYEFFQPIDFTLRQIESIEITKDVHMKDYLKWEKHNRFIGRIPKYK